MKVIIRKGIFSKFVQDEQFIEVLCLARLANSMRFTLLSGMQLGDSSQARRDRSNSFLTALSLIHEGFIVVGRLGKYFHKSKTFKEGYSKIRKSPEYKELKDSVILKIRNKLTFHFSSDAVSETLASLNDEDHILVSSEDLTWKTFYYELADSVAVNYMIGNLKNDNETEDELILRIVKNATVICINFLSVTDKLIEEYYSSIGTRLE